MSRTLVKFEILERSRSHWWNLGFLKKWHGHWWNMGFFEKMTRTKWNGHFEKVLQTKWNGYFGINDTDIGEIWDFGKNVADMGEIWDFGKNVGGHWVKLGVVINKNLRFWRENLRTFLAIVIEWDYCVSRKLMSGCECGFEESRERSGRWVMIRY